MVMQMIIMVMKSIMEQPESRPSRPSSRFAELTVPTMTKTMKGMKNRPRSHWMFRKGTVIEEPMEGVL